jgi:integrase/recombinase XerC
MESLGGPFDRLGRSWLRHLRAENKSPRTLETYGEALGPFARYIARQAIDDVGLVTAEHVDAFITELLDTRAPATANNRFRALQQFFRWLHDEDHVEINPMARLKPPPIPEKPVPILEVADLKALLKTC